MTVNISVPVATQLAAVTKSDSTIVNCQGLYVGTGGDVAIVPMDGTAAVTLTAVPSGTILPIACSKVMSTNTTAAAMVALYV